MSNIKRIDCFDPPGEFPRRPFFLGILLNKPSLFVTAARNREELEDALDYFVQKSCLHFPPFILCKKILFRILL